MGQKVNQKNNLHQAHAIASNPIMMMVNHVCALVTFHHNLLLLLILLIACHYTCQECKGNDLNDCISCPKTRGMIVGDSYSPLRGGECPCIHPLIDFHQKICLSTFHSFSF